MCGCRPSCGTCRAGVSTAPGRRRGAARAPLAVQPIRRRLLDLDACAGLYELLLELLGLVLVDALANGLRGLVDERLGLLEAEARRRADDLDDLDLLVARRRDDDVERRLLLLDG